MKASSLIDWTKKMPLTLIFENMAENIYIHTLFYCVCVYSLSFIVCIHKLYVYILPKERNLHIDE